MLGNRLKLARDFAGLTQAELGEKVGMKQQSIQAIENGETKNPRKINILAEKLDVNLNWLLTGEGTMKSHKSEFDTSIFSKIGKLTSEQKKEVSELFDKFISKNEVMFKEIGGVMMANNYESQSHHHA